MVYFNCLCSSAFLVVLDYLFFCMIAWWTSAGKELTSWLSTYAVLCRLKSVCFFPIWCLGQDVAFGCINS